MTQAVRQRQPNNRYQPTGQPAFRRRELITNDETVVMVAEDKLVNFLPLPRALLRSGIGGNAKLVYSLLLSRGTLSQRNGWADGDFRQVYVIYPVGELAEAMGRSTTTVKRALKELEEAGLIQRRANQTTRANRIYLFLPPDTTDLGEMDFPYAGRLPAKEPLALPEETPALPGSFDWNQTKEDVLSEEPTRSADEEETLEEPQPEEPDWDADETPTQPDLIFWDETLEEVLPEEPVWSKAKENATPDSLTWHHTQKAAQGETSAWGAAEENAIAELLAWNHAEENTPHDDDVPPENDAWWPSDADAPPEEGDAWWPSDADVPPEDTSWWPTDADVPPEEDAWWPSDADVPPEDATWWPSDEDAPPEHPVWCLDGGEAPAFFAPVSDPAKGQVCTPTGARLVCRGFTSGPPPVQI
jgi:hypothetical protein